MGMEFVPGYREANAPRRKEAAAGHEPIIARAKTLSVVKGADSKTTPGNGSGESASIIDKPRHGRAADSVSASTKNQASQENMSADGPGGSGSGGTGMLVETAVSKALKELQADAPACDVCGTITVRSGTCYKCMNCGASMGCS